MLKTFEHSVAWKMRFNISYQLRMQLTLWDRILYEMPKVAHLPTKFTKRSGTCVENRPRYGPALIHIDLLQSLSFYFFVSHFNSLNAELNPICHLLILLGDLTFMGPCIVSIFQYISNKMHRYTVYLHLKTALHVSGGTSTHHQERIQLYLQHLVFVTPLLLSAAIVEELEPV
jgi:hypothetical protein